MHRGDTHHLSDRAPFGFWGVGILRGDEGERAFAGFVEQRLEADVFAVARLERLVVFAEHGAKIDVLQLRQLAPGLLEPLLRGEKKLLHVVALAEVDHVGRAVDFEVLEAVEHGREVGGGVVGGAVGFADDEGLRLEARVLGMKNDQRALALLGETARGDLAVDAVDLVVVEALAERDVEFDSELVVDFLKRRERDVVDVLPDAEILGVAVLEFHQFLLSLGEDGGIGGGGVVADFVEALELFKGLSRESGGVELALVGPDEFAELGAPVADVIVADDARATESEEAADRFADDSGAEVADVHLLRGVRRRVVNDPRLAGASAGGARLELFLGAVSLQPREEGGWFQTEVDETRTREGEVKIGRQVRELIDD